ncbi:CLUMA_CG005888, isoform A [Clunio marinus]|uniref:CLUMA_CG005888, isoform A n=1 Tax=Clunio marinus TaxID=568069 RepID=A0A1J1HW34_9DIPT|nr:CLUMA_CG005888, isoform A [Clunio marinus]
MLIMEVNDGLDRHLDEIELFLGSKFVLHFPIIIFIIKASTTFILELQLEFQQEKKEMEMFAI